MRVLVSELREVAQAVCRIATRDCVMDTDPERPLCTEKNCRMMNIARRAFNEAARISGEETK